MVGRVDHHEAAVRLAFAVEKRSSEFQRALGVKVVEEGDMVGPRVEPHLQVARLVVADQRKQHFFKILSKSGIFPQVFR